MFQQLIFFNCKTTKYKNILSLIVCLDSKQSDEMNDGIDVYFYLSVITLFGSVE